MSRTEYCVVTGAGSGIGRATSILIAETGKHVICCDINTAAAEETVAMVAERGGSSDAFTLDVSSWSGWEALATDIADRPGLLTALVNNAGMVRDKTMLKMDESQWDIVIDVNLKSAWLGSKHLIPVMTEGGSIVNLSSDSKDGNFGQTNYAAAKAGIVGLTRSIAFEQGRRGIRCNAIAPGTIETQILREVPDAVKDKWKETIPLGRFGRPEEVAEVINFLISPRSSYVNGHTLSVDGGSE